MVRMADVAAAAGVSRSTVSLVLSGRAREVGVSQQTQAKVLAVAEELGYRRNELARAVVTGHSPYLAAMVPDLADELVGRCLAAAAAVAREAQCGLQVLSCDVGAEPTSEVARCLAWQPRGVLAYGLSADAESALSQQATARGVTVCAFQPHFGGHPLEPAVSHLLELGHRRVALLSTTDEPALASSFLSAMKAASLSGAEDLVRCVPTDGSGLRDAVRRLLRSPKTAPTAYICTSDALALSVMRQVRRLDRRVPKRISVVGWGNTRAAEVADPPLTSVDPPVAAMARAATERLLGLATAEGGMEPNLVVRRSTAAVGR